MTDDMKKCFVFEKKNPVIKKMKENSKIISLAKRLIPAALFLKKRDLASCHNERPLISSIFSTYVKLHSLLSFEHIFSGSEYLISIVSPTDLALSCKNIYSKSHLHPSDCLPFHAFQDSERLLGENVHLISEN